jgi:hypothetical protein
VRKEKGLNPEGVSLQVQLNAGAWRRAVFLPKRAVVQKGSLEVKGFNSCKRQLLKQWCRIAHVG